LIETAKFIDCYKESEALTAWDLPDMVLGLQSGIIFHAPEVEYSPLKPFFERGGVTSGEVYLLFHSAKEALPFFLSLIYGFATPLPIIGPPILQKYLLPLEYELPTEVLEATSILPDVLMLGLKVVFCGTAVGVESAKVGAYYAGRGNRFWSILHETGLTSDILEPHKFRSLTRQDIGLTDLIKSRSGTDKDIPEPTEDCIADLRSKVKWFEPKVLAFNGKKAARWFLELKSTREIDYGLQQATIGQTVIFVLPSTSAASGHWDESPWHKLAEFVREMRKA
jgi:TDG/mug DNA glycosylase family protein